MASDLNLSRDRRPFQPVMSILEAGSVGLLVVLSLLLPVEVAATEAGPITKAQAQDDPGTEPAKEPPEPSKGPLRQRLEERLYGATPEERAQLSEERKRISEAAAAFGTDPTAIIGYYQAGYAKYAFTNGARLDTATAVIRLPVTPNFLFQVTMPYWWADPNQPKGSTVNGTSDMTVRIGSRLYSSENIALLIGGDASFPTSSSEKQLGTGKYTVGPGGAVAVPMPRLQSLWITLVQDFNSVGGDPSRNNIHFMQVQSAINTIWSEHWWTQAIMTWDMDWNNNRKTTMNLLWEVGHRFDNHWNVFAGPGIGVVGRDTFLGLDWTMQAGVRWVFRTPLIPERVFKSLPRN